MSAVQLKPIGYVRAARQSQADDYWGGSTATIELADDIDPESLLGIEEFSHAEVVYLFHQVAPEQVTWGARHPRGNPSWPRVGIFAQRAKARPNRLGLTIVPIRSRDGRRLLVAELDAIDGTPVLDIKPVMVEFLPRGPVHQPRWADELMRDYWLPEQR